ncbi:MAG: hypothetical protein ACN6OD_11250, partial [Alcaligenes sp.]
MGISEISCLFMRVSRRLCLESIVIAGFEYQEFLKSAAPNAAAVGRKSANPAVRLPTASEIGPKQKTLLPWGFQARLQQPTGRRPDTLR